MSSASAFSAPSLTTLGAPSTTSLASFRPKPVTSRTTLITLTLFGPTSVSSTSNSLFSSAAPAPSPPAAATTTPAAADTPNSSSHAFTNSFNSNTLNSLIASNKLCCCQFCHYCLPPFCYYDYSNYFNIQGSSFHEPQPWLRARSRKSQRTTSRKPQTSLYARLR